MVRLQLLGNINLMSFPELIKLLKDGEEMGELLALDPEVLLKRWVNYHMELQEYPRRIKNFGNDLKDAKVYTVLLKSIGDTMSIQEGQGCNMEMLKWNDFKRANQVLVTARNLGVTPFLTENDILKGDDKFNLALSFLLLTKSQLFTNCTSPNMTGSWLRSSTPIRDWATWTKWNRRNWPNCWKTTTPTTRGRREHSECG